MTFKETFLLLLDIEKKLNDFSKPIDPRIQGDAKLKQAEKKAQFHLEAKNSLTKLLEEKKDSKAKIYIQQIVQNIQNDLKLTPEQMLVAQAPPYVEFSPNPNKIKYGNFYNQNRYESLLAYCTLAYWEEKKGLPEEHALKLSVAFDDVTSALNYIRDNKDTNDLIIHDACLFQLPNVNECDFATWKKFIKAYINDKPFRDLLPNAPELEKQIINNKPPKSDKEKQVTSDKLLIKSDKKKPKTVKRENLFKLLTVHKKSIEETNKAFKALERHAGGLTEKEKPKKDKLVNELSKKRQALFKLSAGLKLKEMDLALLVACNEQFMLDTQAAYKFMIEHGLKRKNFTKFLRLKRQDDDDKIPDIKIDGKDLGYPGIYLMKVPVMNEQQAARAACLGKLTNCCQSLSDIGEACVLHGLTSPYGGFYVICKGDINNPKVEDEVLAQSWTWRSANDAIVFDSIEIPKIESDKKKKEHKKLVKKMYDALTFNLINNKYCEKVACGSTSGMSKEMGARALPNHKEKFVDYDGYCDSIVQQVIYDPKNPYYLYTRDTKKASAIVQSATDHTIHLLKDGFSKEKLAHSDFIFHAFQFLIIKNKGKNENKNDLLDKIITLSKEYHKEEELKDLLTANDYRNKKGLTLLMSACNNGLEKAFDYLVTEKNINTIDNSGNTALILAAKKLTLAKKNNYENIVLKLIESGADINEENKDGKTALYYAAHSPKKNLNTCLALIENGANVETQIDGNSILVHALMNNVPELVYKLIEKGSNLNAYDASKNTPLMFTAIEGFEDLCKILIENGADLNIKDDSGYTALLKAIDHHNESVALSLIEAGADPNCKNNNGETPLMFAARNGYKNIISALINKGANIDEKDNKGNTVFYYADEHLKLALTDKIREAKKIAEPTKQLIFSNPPDQKNKEQSAKLSAKNKESKATLEIKSFNKWSHKTEPHEIKKPKK